MSLYKGGTRTVSIDDKGLSIEDRIMTDEVRPLTEAEQEVFRRLYEQYQDRIHNYLLFRISLSDLPVGAFRRLPLSRVSSSRMLAEPL